MFKILGIVCVSLLMLGCSTHKSDKENRHQMFQSVNVEEATLTQEGDKKRYCTRCGMDLVKFYKTSHAATHNSQELQYCSIHCLEEHLGEGEELKNPKVVDVASLKLIDATKAFYVVGSSKKATMSKVSKYAFLQEAKAKEFQAEFGGEIMDFNGAREKAQEDFKHYKK